MEIRFWADTDTGRSRDHNEDNFLVDRTLRVFVVCDGIGGHAAGEVASATAIRAIQESLDEALDVLTRSRLATGGDERREKLMGHLADAVKLANERVYSHASSPDIDRQMGTTCSLLMLVGNRGFVAHVGDSRIYRIRGESGEQLTDDHSLRQEMIRRGQLEEDEAFDQTDAITRAVGVEEELEVDTFEIDVEPGDRFVLCSDGLSEYISRTSNLTELASVPDLRQVVNACIDHANKGGGKDNVTAIAVEARDGNGVYDALQLDDRLHAIGQSRPFRDLNGEELHLAFRNGEIASFEPDEKLIDKGEPAGKLRVVLDGNLVVVDHRGEQAVDVGAAVGTSWWLGEADAQRRIEAGEQGVTTFEMTRDDLISLMAADRKTGTKVLWNASRALADELNRARLTLVREFDQGENEAAVSSNGSGAETTSAPVSGETKVSDSSLAVQEKAQSTETVQINLDDEADTP